MILASCGGSGGSGPAANLAVFCADFDKTTNSIDAQFNRLEPP